MRTYMAKKRTFREFKQGTFHPINKGKCLNPDNISFRSGLESQLMVILDKNPNIISWGSENVIIPYFKKAENRWARYFVDFYVKIKLGENVKEYIIEVKPEKFTKPPTTNGNKKKSTILYEQVTYLTDSNKWEAAKKWCDDQKLKNKRDIEFMIITEKNIAQLTK